MGNPTIQTDLLAHEHLGGKTLVYLGDGLYPTKIDHRTIDKFDMYPFNGDWTNSLFFSQDPVAIDSVMYDFLYTEGTDPIEGSQNYLHQSAEPMPNKYDPENDGEYLDYSLGVHEHWDTSVDIFSSERYEVIDFVTIPITDNSPPDKPTITGPTSGSAGTSYEYTISAIDPDGDPITYCIDWCGCGEEVCLGPFGSGDEIKASYSWDEKGSFTIKVKARDDSNAESNWATLTVSMPKIIISNIALFRVIKNLFEHFPMLEKMFN